MTRDGHIGFEWDPRKARANALKHGVSFEEARTVFADPYARIADDPDRSDNEERFVVVGMSLKANVLTVCHCIRRGGSSVRIISARRATRNESREYWRFYHEG